MVDGTQNERWTATFPLLRGGILIEPRLRFPDFMLWQQVSSLSFMLPGALAVASADMSGYRTAEDRGRDTWDQRDRYDDRPTSSRRSPQKETRTTWAERDAMESRPA